MLKSRTAAFFGRPIPALYRAEKLKTSESRRAGSTGHLAGWPCMSDLNNRGCATVSESAEKQFRAGSTGRLWLG